MSNRFNKFSETSLGSSGDSGPMKSIKVIEISCRIGLARTIAHILIQAYKLSVCDRI
jgi:hypothetical protein